ncbi:hypothetical protein [Sphingomonas sp. GM_Shp_2]|uniref:hypothetical protein n=1 Tax=Sphingomonas sp. GM_Shp_2 TaxID=2937380 RepID=UPI00226ABDF2|nr:hypothetical protein [Sphingomonas sp. GM_Shp_2]
MGAEPARSAAERARQGGPSTEAGPSLPPLTGIADDGNSEDRDGRVEEEGYNVIPEDALHLLPAEWREEIIARAEDGRRVLGKANEELIQLSRLSASYYHVGVLKHIRERLADYRFRTDMDAFFELDMLTTAFVATYVRLFTGGNGSGFARKALPEPLRAAHDEIIDLRNKRYAHVAAHDSVNDAMEIQEVDGRFVVYLGMRLGYYIGGSNEWTKLVDALEAMFAERSGKIIDRLQARTGREWTIAQGPSPDAEAATRDGVETDARGDQE